MNGAELVRLVTNALFLVVFVGALRTALRERSRTSIDASILFGALAFVIAQSQIMALLGAQLPAALGLVSAVLLLGLPYLQLRLVDDFAGVRPLLLRACLGGFLAGTAAVVIGLLKLVVLPAALPVIVVLALIFVPLERALPQYRDQRVFRPEWTTDGVHFLISHLIVQAFSWAALLPSQVLRNSLLPPGAFAPLRSLPLPVQFLAVLLLADLTQYWIHRCFHRLPALWSLHAVHHSSTAMDWLAGSRMHPLDALATRAAVMTVLVLAGAAPAAVAIYLAFVSFHAVFIHANFGAGLRWLDKVLVTPRYHHFHHAAEAAAIDKNFAVHLPMLDRIFGTQFLPETRWPEGYGLAQGGIARTYLAQILGPFRASSPFD